MPILAILGIIGAVVAILGGGGLIGWWRNSKPVRDRAEKGWDAILGEADTFDRNGQVMHEGQPGLVARVSDLETASKDQAAAMKNLAQVLANQKELSELVLTLQREQGVLAVRVTSLERHEDERIEIRRESTALLNAVAERDTLNVEPE